MVPWLMAALVGGLAGLHTATWGMYKDSLHEGFTWPKYARSVVVGGSAGLVIQSVLGLDLVTASGLLQLFALSYVLERGLVEFWKTFVRREDQSKYFIPMQFAVFGRVVNNPAVRGAVGFSCALALGLLVSGLIFLQGAGSAVPLTTALLLGSTGGWVSALGGAWKDAPVEGFELFKFFRSPGISAGYGLLLATLTTNYVVVAFGALGLTVATIETYKTFAKAKTPRGKFAGKPVLFPDMLAFRRPFAAVYAVLWVAILVTASLALSSAADGLVYVARQAPGS